LDAGGGWSIIGEFLVAELGTKPSTKTEE